MTLPCVWSADSKKGEGWPIQSVQSQPGPYHLEVAALCDPVQGRGLEAVEASLLFLSYLNLGSRDPGDSSTNVTEPLAAELANFPKPGCCRSSPYGLALVPSQMLPNQSYCYHYLPPSAALVAPAVCQMPRLHIREARSEVIAGPSAFPATLSKARSSRMCGCRRSLAALSPWD